MKRTAPAAILLATGLIAGCSTSEPLSQKADFQSTVATKADSDTLAVPPDLTSPQQQNKYALPTSGVASATQMNLQQTPAAQPASQATNASPLVIVAGEQPVLKPVDHIRMVRAGNQRWLVVDSKSAAQLWPVLKAFWQDSGFTIKSEEPDIGLMETDWAMNRAKLPQDGIRKLMDYIGLGDVYDTSERDMFRIRLEKTDNGGTEIYFSHQGMEEVYTDSTKSDTRWQPRAPDPGLEAEMLTRFMTRLGLTEEQASNAVKQTVAPDLQQVAPITNGTLTISDTFDRAWRRVGLALDRIGLIVTDRDRSQGIYYVKPAENEADSKSDNSPGFWSRMAFWRSASGPATATDNSMRVIVKETTPGNTSITVTDKQGAPLNDKFTKAALGKMQEELQ